ncbi:glycosyltransferase family 4 protein [Flavobacterium caseinilyticum]|uniref:Glycosyltransferase family 4 protein n=1 Tax=Flavobacterium caseinilyticum TaxID=2541732 RepID=A0A4R5AXK9_9FLAO|nr:glycosyltransferase family 4 protein [Flavobacterium caseinilyticum]TDD75934.1 glycosyltransferase family 4 protein [Flavobacterium caseinilyticum]
MKLLYITNGINGAGGLERVLSIKASYLADHYQYEVTILCLNNADENPFYTFSDKIKMISMAVGGNPIQYINAYKKGIQNVVEQTSPDVISVCDDGLKGFFIPKIVGKNSAVIYERHVSKEIEMNVSFSFFKKQLIQIKWKLMEQLASSFSKFVVLTTGNTKEWPSLSNMVVIPNPLSFYPKESSTLQNKKVIAVGKQGFQKGYDRLLAAWKLVHLKHPDWQLEIYGTIAPEYKLEELSKSLGIFTSVFFYPPEKDIQRKYMNSSVYVMSSRFEGFGMVLIEAMACGVPCVSFDCNYGPADIISQNVDGLLLPNGDITALANSIITLISQEQLRISMGENAKLNVQRFLPEVVVKEWDILFKQLVQ